MRATVAQIPPAQDATWGAAFSALLRTHPKDWQFHWTGHDVDEPGAYSMMTITVRGQDDVDGMRAEIVEVVDLVNGLVERDPLHKMVEIDPGLVEVFVA